ncbi:cupin domain-containing protein [Streptomyces sp. A7024]|uniref:Cupin domain-containing protein n=1 Tax=Streptomyces coryli TaxID=1128680 RepID=A0A6G4TZQ7_9ACTN|nr:cupin domain-containing protein [Streptomyces coryli]NGN65499.1 cupin domain-containing protein [Streptomyces coryli]
MGTATYDGLPGGIAISHLTVYDWPTTDGLRGGTPHLHLTCTEGYVVTGGSGMVQTLTASGYAETPLAPGALVWFTPGTIHRLVNEGDLKIVVMMQNSGLPEAGDAVLTLPPELLRDPETYAAAVRIPPDGTEAAQAAAARRRRDLAIGGFLKLRAATEAGDPEPLAAFHRAAAALVRPRLDDWEQRWRTGAAAASGATVAQLATLRGGDAGYLAAASVRAEQPAAHGKFGMCGRLDVYATD